MDSNQNHQNWYNTLLNIDEIFSLKMHFMIERLKLHVEMFWCCSFSNQLTELAFADSNRSSNKVDKMKPQIIQASIKLSICDYHRLLYYYGYENFELTDLILISYTPQKHLGITVLFSLHLKLSSPFSS